jgi:micrococcal nuclease
MKQVKTKNWLTLLFLLIFLPVICFSQEYIGTILRVIDGDTFVFQTNEGSLRVRMFGIDAPEKGQTFGPESKRFMEGYLNKTGVLSKKSIDKYGRTLGMLFIDKVNINLECVKKGYAWHYAYYYKNAEFAQAEKEARIKKLGLWQYEHPIPPWEYRKNYKSI